jgi:methionine-rich copper-binding protein CopC
LVSVAGCALAALIGAVLLASPASAHAVLLSTTPATSGQVASAPAAVVLNFNEQPHARYSTVHVVGPDGQRRDSGAVQVVNDSVTESLGGTRPAGKYVVDWRVISSDGHPVAGQLSFTATAAGSALPARQAEAPAAKSSSNSTALVVVIVAVVVIALIGLFFLLRRRSAVQGEERSSFS